MPQIDDKTREKARIAPKEVETQNAQLDDPEIEIVMTETVGEIDEVVFSALKGIRRYEIIRAPQETLEEWKRGVDEIIQVITNHDITEVRKLMKKGERETGDADSIAKLISEEHLDDIDIILLAIGLFILREKAPWHVRKSGLKVLKGGKIKMESIFDPDSWANCYDVVVIAGELANMYGINGEVIGKGFSHAHFETDDGKISDPMYGWQRGGLFQTKEKFKAFKKEMGLLRRMGLR